MADPNQLTDLLEKLSIREYSKEECIAAMEGKRVPKGFGWALLRLCTIRGIRYTDGFGNELRGITPEITRALNAQDIMNNRVPQIDTDDEMPYCIWHPRVGSEDTYRKLVKRYPSMKYQVARACAVAGYTELYEELDVLPDVHIAEEARESGNMAICEKIVSKPTRYSVMKDYDRTLNAKDPSPANLNGDTATCSTLDEKQGFHQPTQEKEYGFECETWDLTGGPGYDEDVRLNITEDMNIGTSEEYLGLYQAKRNDAEMNAKSNLLIHLLSEPLPRDLPTVDEDLLINMAACHGDIDRYTRLRRPKLEWASYSHYHEALAARISVTGLKENEYEDWKRHFAGSTLQMSGTDFRRSIESCDPTPAFDGMYDHTQCDFDQTELFACLPEERRIPEEDEDFWKTLDYVEWPPKGL